MINLYKIIWPVQGSNQRPLDLQSDSLPTALGGQAHHRSQVLYSQTVRPAIWAQHEKTNKVAYVSSEDSSAWAFAQSDRVFTMRSVGSMDPRFLHVDSEDWLWSDWADAQAECSLGAQVISWFGHEAAYLAYRFFRSCTLILESNILYSLFKKIMSYWGV